MKRLIVQNLTKYYESDAGQIKVLENLNLEVSKGDFIAIMGPSGSGKSTLLFLLGCLDYPDFGSIFMDDMDITQESEATRERLRLLRIGFVFQSFHLVPTLTALENVLLPMQLAGSFRGKQRERGAALLRLVGLEGKADSLPSAISGGEQQRVAIARALANLPGLILADEPTGNLDAKTGKEIMEVIRSINDNQGVVILLATHDAKIASYADRIYYLEDGILRGTAL